jgi:hypothetical protein
VQAKKVFAGSSGEDLSDEEYTGRTKGTKPAVKKGRGRKPKRQIPSDEEEEEEEQEEEQEEEEPEEPAPRKGRQSKQKAQDQAPQVQPVAIPAPQQQMYFPGQQQQQQQQHYPYTHPQFSPSQAMYYMSIPPQNQGFDSRFQQPLQQQPQPPIYYMPQQGGFLPNQSPQPGQHGSEHRNWKWEEKKVNNKENKKSMISKIKQKTKQKQQQNNDNNNHGWKGRLFGCFSVEIFSSQTIKENNNKNNKNINNNNNHLSQRRCMGLV